MIIVEKSELINSLCPELVVATIECDIINTEYSATLWKEISAESEKISKQYKITDINKRINIKATREAYKKTGKEPNRYRPSAEALCRRIVKGIELYKINTIVDLINLISLNTGISIGGFDAEKIEGDLILSVGTKDDLFYGIGRGQLNVDGLPMYKDKIGGIGTPTSDEERTKLSLNTKKLFMIINSYNGQNNLPNVMSYSIDRLIKYVDAKNIIINYY